MSEQNITIFIAENFFLSKKSYLLVVMVVQNACKNSPTKRSYLDLHFRFSEKVLLNLFIIYAIVIAIQFKTKPE